MILFILVAGSILIYGAAYTVFCIQKGGIAAALSVLFLQLLDLALLLLLLYYRINT